MLHAVWNALAKRARDQLVFLWSSVSLASVVLVPVGLLGLPEGGVPAAAVPYVVATIVIHAGYFDARPCLPARRLLTRLPDRARPRRGAGASGRAGGLRRATLAARNRGRGSGRRRCRGPPPRGRLAGRWAPSAARRRDGVGSPDGAPRQIG